MKAIYYGIVLFGFFAVAQPTLNIDDFGAQFSADVYHLVGASPNALIRGGANVTWDFSNMSLQNHTGTIMTVPISEIPNASDYPNATIAVHQQFFVGTGYYEVFEVTPSSYKRLAIMFENGDIIDNIGSPINIVHQLPAAYLQTFENSKYDGYGTLITPLGRFSNVIRIKRDFESDRPASNRHTVYEWYATSPYRKIFTATLYCCVSYPGPFVMLYDYELLSNQNFNDDNNFLIYLDLQSTELIIETHSSQKFDVSVFNSIGEEVLNIKNLIGDERLNMSQFQSGIYIVKIFNRDSGSQSIKKIIKG